MALSRFDKPSGQEIGCNPRAQRIYGREAGSFFSRCYDIHSGLLHSHDPLSSTSDIMSRIPHLREFMADLICSV